MLVHVVLIDNQQDHAFEMEAVLCHRIFVNSFNLHISEDLAIYFSKSAVCLTIIALYLESSNSNIPIRSTGVMRLLCRTNVTDLSGYVSFQLSVCIRLCFG